MKVQIQYRIELDEVPKKIGQLVEEAMADLQKQIDDMSAINELCKQGKYLEVVESGIDKLRKELVSVDTTLGDAHSICSGLIRHLSPEPAMDLPPPVPVQEPPTTTEPVDPVEPVEKK